MPTIQEAYYNRAKEQAGDDPDACICGSKKCCLFTKDTCLICPGIPASIESEADPCVECDGNIFKKYLAKI